ncbi:unnamed protein product [Prorocentrum cordatum]|uniref:Uncharacterized protein n=2 Tax=Prorocentrum cordatum TaxID=2364126 RepID=A0ABN9TSS6_9DINO|nr:unnamed protein product [Polarella glacialis]
MQLAAAAVPWYSLAFLLVFTPAPTTMAAAGAGEQQVTPVQKVITLMEGMMEQGTKEKKAEQVQFAAYKQFCEDTTSLKQKAIAEANDKIEVLKADIEKYLSDAEQLKKEIEGHDADISAWDGDMAAASKVRQLEKADYETLHTDYSESVGALQRAIEVLKKQAYNRPQAAFVQLADLNGLSLIPPEAKRAIAVFLQQDPDAAAEGLEVSAPEAYGYEFQSKGVIDMLEKLLDKFIAERTTLEKTETKTQQEFEMLMQDLESSTAQSKQDREEKAELKAKALQAKADAEGDLTDTTTTRDADQQYLTDLVATCEQKATDFESRQTLRAEELVAVQKAIDIISTDAVSGNAEKHLAATDEEKAAYGPAFAALRSATSSEFQEQAARYLRQQAGRIGSRVLSTLAARVEADPFKKVKKMIKDLITRLMEEANEEAEHKGWCDTELSTNEQTRKTKTQAVETLHAEIDQLQTSTAKLTEEIAEHTKAVAELQKAMAEATELRKTEKEKNEETIKDAQEAQTAVAQALTVLKEFYARAAEATAFVQQQPEPPPIFEKAYTGMGGESGGVVSMLEVIESDFARLEGDTAAAEQAAQQEYETFITDSKVDLMGQQKDVEHKTAKVKSEKKALVVKAADLEGTQKELDAALLYFDKLKPSCIDAGTSYEGRVARREEEIESLQTALRILNGEDI